MNREKLIHIISKCCLEATADKMADAIMQALKEDEKPIPEWEKRFYEAVRMSTLDKGHSVGVADIKDFIRSEFRKIKKEFVEELFPERYYPDVERYTRDRMYVEAAINEVLKKRGIYGEGDMSKYDDGFKAGLARAAEIMQAIFEENPASNGRYMANELLKAAIEAEMEEE